MAVIDNDSRDDSVAWLRSEWPDVRIFRCENRGLCSFNEVVHRLEGSVAILLNNDIKLDAEAIDPLVNSAGIGHPSCFMTALRTKASRRPSAGVGDWCRRRAFFLVTKEWRT